MADESSDDPDCDAVSDAPFEPSEAEIREGCKAIQAEWSDYERASRLVAPQPDRWTVPERRNWLLRSSDAGE